MTDAVKTFAELGVEPAIRKALESDGIVAPFPIQELTLPLALSGADLIGQARTGTGKTLAFGIPLLQRVDPQSDRTQALVIVPTRELCLQVHDDLAALGRSRSVRAVAAYGGKAIDPQSEAIAEGAPVVVGTPGRLLDLRRRGMLDLSTVTTLVLDEADEMLDMGFLPDVEQLIRACADERQTLLFSATIPAEVVALARRYLHKPTFIRAEVEEPRIAPETDQHFFACHRMDKPAVLARILASPGRGLCVVFVRTKRMADTLVGELAGHGVTAVAIHSDLRQEARERALSRFRRGTIDVLCATEVAARGLDIDSVTHVVNYDCPDDEKMYLHRIGRTGRAGAPGVAISLAVWNELARLEVIKKALEVDEPTHEVFSTSPILDQLFDLPPARQPKRRQSPRQRPAAKPGSREDRPAPDVAADGGRSRTRSRSTEREASAPASAEEPADGTVRSRVRRRTRSTPDTPQRPAPAAKESARAESPDAESADAPSRMRRRTRAPVRPGDQRENRRTASSGTGDRPAGSRRAESKRRGGGDRKQQAKAARSGQGRRAAATPAGGNGRGGELPDPDAARGEGKPGLHRRMVITHLP